MPFKLAQTALIALLASIDPLAQLQVINDSGINYTVPLDNSLENSYGDDLASDSDRRVIGALSECFPGNVFVHDTTSGALLHDLVAPVGTLSLKFFGRSSLAEVL